MRSCAARRRTSLITCACLSALLAACGGAGLDDELSAVPGLSLLHVHLEAGGGAGRLSGLLGLGDHPAAAIADSLLREGPVGVTLLGINLTDLSPRLMLLSGSVDHPSLAELAAGELSAEVSASGERTDLQSDRGRILGSVAERDGWSCLCLGTGADGAVANWLELEPEAALSADTAIAALAGAGTSEVTILVSSNTLSFLSFVPSGMMTPSEREMMDMAMELIDTVEPKAVRLDLELPGGEGAPLTAALTVRRPGGAEASLSLTVSATGLDPLEALPEAIEWLAGLEGR